MTNRDRFIAVLNGHRPDDRLPVIEWASWWDLTLTRWHGEGLDPTLNGDALFEALDLDIHRQYWLRHKSRECPEPVRHGAALINNEADYERLKPLLYPEDAILPMLEDMRSVEPRHIAGDMVLWFTLEGAFWFPRTLFGIEGHLYSFYDYPGLYRRILDDLAEFEIKQLEKIYSVCTPEFMTIAEDMSYNNGPMLSKKLFFEFLAPFYERVIPFIHAHGTKVIVDTDGDVTLMVPWLEKVGVDGVLPLEYQAGVDISKIRREHPDFLMLGGFNKRIMKDGEAAMRAEFERVLPVMRSGGYIPSVDHQTPPDVSLETYHVYVRLLHEYVRKSVQI